jgi:hypothetical protein
LETLKTLLFGALMPKRERETTSSTSHSHLLSRHSTALDAGFSKLTVHGGRMNEMQMRAVERAA